MVPTGKKVYPEQVQDLRHKLAEEERNLDELKKKIALVVEKRRIKKREFRAIKKEADEYDKLIERTKKRVRSLCDTRRRDLEKARDLFAIYCVNHPKKKAIDKKEKHTRGCDWCQSLWWCVVCLDKGTKDLDDHEKLCKTRTKEERDQVLIDLYLSRSSRPLTAEK